MSGLPNLNNSEHCGPEISIPHILVIDPGVRTPELDTFNLIASISPLPCIYQMPAMFGFETMPSDFYGVRGVIILGSLASVYDQLPWQSKIEKWTEQLILKGIPVLGCCYGFQMLAHMFGGKVEFINPEKSKHQGVRQVEVMNNSLWAPGIKRLIVTHSEQVIKLPQELSLIAKSNEIAIDGFAHKNKPVFGLQAHPEATKLFLKDRQLLTAHALESLKDGHEMIRSFVHMAAKFSW